MRLDNERIYLNHLGGDMTIELAFYRNSFFKFHMRTLIDLSDLYFLISRESKNFSASSLEVKCLI